MPEKISVRRVAGDLLTCLKSMLLAAAVGIVVGAAATAFSYTLRAVNTARAQHPWLLFLLPVAGVAIAFLYHITDTDSPRGTNLVIAAVRQEDVPPFKMAPLIFVSTAITHLCGGSAGREGAALQLGGALGAQMGRMLHLDSLHEAQIVMCGMAAAFSALFGTPVAAAVFALELASVGIMQYAALLPCIVSSATAALLAHALGAESETIALSPIDTTPVSLLQCAFLGLLCAGVGVIMCIVLHKSGHALTKLLPNPCVRAIVGGAVVIVLVYVFGTREYLGAGMDIVTRTVEEGWSHPAAFILKLLFTAVTLGAGFKGGEIVPTFFVGAAFGCTVGPLFGLDAHFAAAIGTMCLFCAVTNCPVASLLLAFELFGYGSPALFLVAIAISYTMSGYYSLYSSQLFSTEKLEPVLSPHKSH